MLFNLQKAQKISRPGFTAYVYNDKKQYPALEAVYVDCFKNHEKVYVKKSHRLYFVIAGEGTFYVDKETHTVKQNDVIIIEPLVRYAYEGKMKLFEVNCPATDNGDEAEVK
ncbi:MAG: hypothetical protein WC480_04190 [Patescibacteria group bacterium]